VSERDPALDALWKHVLDNWQNAAAHRAFLDHCQRSDALVEAAVRYRGMKGDHERGASAEKHLNAVLMLAMSRLEVARSEPRASSGNWPKLVLIGFFSLGSLLILLYLMRT
jgi:hypothetical protein